MLRYIKCGNGFTISEITVSPIEKKPELPAKELDMKIINCNVNWISDILSYKRFCKYENIINESGTGTGKTSTLTKHLARYLEENPEIRFISIFGKRSLGEQHLQGFKSANIQNLAHYEDKDFYENYQNKNIMICVNSVYKIPLVLSDIKKYIVILDEVSIFTTEITHNSTISNLVNVYLAIRGFIKFSHKLYVCQNKINDSALSLITSRLNYKKKTLFIHNNFKNNQNKKAIKFNSVNELLERMQEDINNNKYFLFSCDNKKQTDIIYKKMIDNAEDKEKFFKFSSDPNEKYKAGFNWSEKWVFYTPTIGAGIDVNLEKAQNHYVLVVGGSVGGDVIFQMSMRTRNLETLYYCCAKIAPTECKYESFKHCYDTLKYDKEILNNSLMNMCYNLDQNDNVVFTENSFYELFAQNQYLLELMNCDIVKTFEEELVNSGFNIIEQEKKCNDYTDELKTIRKELEEFKEQEFYNFIDDKVSNLYMQETCDILQATQKNDKLMAKPLLLSSTKLQNHFNIFRLFATDKYLKDKIKSLKCSTYDDKLLQNIYIQIRHVRRLMEEYNIDFFDINKNGNENIVLSEEMKKILKSIFNHRSTITTRFDAIKFICRKINSICGEIFMYNKKKKLYTINKEYLMNNFNIYNLRNKKFENIRVDIVEYLGIEYDDIDIFDVFNIIY